MRTTTDWPLLLSFALTLGACGSGVAVDDVLPVDASVDGAHDATTGSDAVAFDVAAPDAPDDATKFNGGGPFLCNACVCDGTLDMCFFASGGAQPAPLDDGGADAEADAGPDAGPGACDSDASTVGCVPIPVDCLPKPTCACLMTHYPPQACTCTVDPTGNGLHVQCMYP